MSLYEKDLIGFAGDHTFHRMRYALEALVGRLIELPRAKFKIDLVEINSPHILPQMLRVLYLIQRVVAPQGLYGRSNQGIVDLVL